MIGQRLKKNFKIGRNEKCPCGSGKKYKYCCWSKEFDRIKAEREALDLLKKMKKEKENEN